MAKEGTISSETDHASIPTKYEQGCRSCEIKSNKFVPAIHIGLPCGHLIFCELCVNVSKTKAESSTDDVACPYYQCGRVLAGSMRVYYT